jgi:hypothetical protein
MYFWPGKGSGELRGEERLPLGFEGDRHESWTKGMILELRISLPEQAAVLAPRAWGEVLVESE